MLWKAQAGLLGARFIGTHLFAWNWMPAGHGATASMDSLVMVSPGFFRRHVQPHLDWLAGQMGGLCIHSCGHFKHMGKPLLATQGLTGVNAGQANMAELATAGFDGSVVLSGRSSLEGMPRDLKAIVDHRLRCDLTVHGIWRDGAPESWGASAWSDSVERAWALNRTLTTAAAAWSQSTGG
jgi:hypothetical protein